MGALACSYPQGGHTVVARRELARRRRAARSPCRHGQRNSGEEGDGGVGWALGGPCPVRRLGFSLFCFSFLFSFMFLFCLASIIFL